ncbi:MAG TPA: 6-carboxytetrahydropterin synthase, partial [Burkholderiales bacterium]|nr:6-carboxytetrahydropterin synthase [Burkholderiales bacterium]
VLEHTTTVENLAATAFGILDRAYHDVYGNQLRLQKLRLYETPNCWVDVDRDPQE